MSFPNATAMLLLVVAICSLQVAQSYPAAAGQMAYYHQQPLYRAYQPHQRVYYRHQQPAYINKYALRRSSADEVAPPANDETPVLLQGDEQQFVLGEGEIGVGLQDAEQQQPLADELPSFQGDPAAVQNDEEQQYADEAPAQVAADTPQRRPSKQAAPSPPHTFFPMNFGNSGGASIAVANSFSTGKGSAASHAVAYGNAKPTTNGRLTGRKQ